MKRREEREYAFYFAQVTSVNREAHVAICRQLGAEEESFGRSVLVETKGDVSLPSVGDVVAVMRGEGEREVIVGTIYEDEPPETDPGDRRIGHRDNDTNLTIKEDGTMRIEADGALEVATEQGSIEVDESGAITVNTSGGSFEIQSNGNVVVNGGSSPVVTDVSYTGESISVTYSSDLFVP